MSKIKIGLPSKGRLKDESLAYLKSKKLEVVNSYGERNYFFNIKNNNEIDGIF
ncbi:MAG: ATP phosphoribosyltransferase, partial [Proteobacteria bacterium]|nr:ATP phosphoribosyltransferase [Candidatus Fonsibacter sp. PEL4]